MKRFPRARSLTLGAVLMTAGIAANLAFAQVDVAKSAVTAVAKQIGVSMEGKFKRFDATVAFDPAKLATSSARVDIDMTSFEIGDAVTTKELRGKDWFDVAKYPKATFVSTAIKPAAAAGKFDVAGKLTIKGKSMDVVVPATYRKDGASQIFEGALPVKRNAFNIGDGEWKDTSVIADEIQIKFRIVTAAQK